MADTSNKNFHAHYLKTMGIEMWVRRSLLSELSESASENELKSMTVKPTKPTLAENITPSENQDIKSTLVAETAPAIFEKNIMPESSENQTEWDVLQKQVSECTACELCRTRTQTVFGVGNRQADWLFVGEAPGADEDAQGEPFVGRAGKLLNSMLYAVDLPRETIYIANILKCRPPDNRNPTPEERVHCTPFLNRQIALIKPKIIIALGTIAAQYLLSTVTPIGKLRNIRFEYSDTGIPLIATYHPAYLLRRPIMKRESWKDLQFAQQEMKK